MLVILDFQACQSGSRFRGIGRASRSLLLSMGRNLLFRGHDVICLLNFAFQDGFDDLKADISSHIPNARIVTFRTPIPCAPVFPENAWRQMASLVLREQIIASFEPDFVHIPALLSDGWGDDSVASLGLLGVNIPVSLTHHDLIPLVMSENYMQSSNFRDYYINKLNYVKNASLLMAISDYSRREVIEWIGINPENVISISSAVDRDFWRPIDEPHISFVTLKKFGLRPGFFLYAPGGFDYRKNLDRLFEAYSLLPISVREAHQLVIASLLDSATRKILENSISSYGLMPHEVTFTDYISDYELHNIYCSCFAYVFPSLHEGFGLPALEAMSCGVAVIASNCTSIPEVMGIAEALFDPYDANSIASKMMQLHTDENFRKQLQEHSIKRSDYFSWTRTGDIAVSALEKYHQKLLDAGWQRTLKSDIVNCNSLLKLIQKLVPEISPSIDDLKLFYSCYELNNKQL